MFIIGAGLAGLLAAKVFPEATVLEASSKPTETHRALLRFRSDAVSRLTGIKFKEVRVRKGIWYNGKFQEPNILLANLYSQKCLGYIDANRSIWNLDTVTRYIAPDDFYQQLLDETTVLYDHPYDARLHEDKSEAPPIISTMPLPFMMDIVGMPKTTSFRRAGIHVVRGKVPSCNAYQTIYYPGSGDLYRASITGDTLICEFVGDPSLNGAWKTVIEESFGINTSGVLFEHVEQKYGKIVDIDPIVRHGILHRLTQEHNIFSVGRFATWRNILLDDVVQDLERVRGLVKMSNYERTLEMMNERRTD